MFVIIFNFFFGFSVMIQDAMFGSMLDVFLSRKSLWMEIHHFLNHFIVKSADSLELTRKILFSLPLFEL